LFAALERFRSGERAAAAFRELVQRTLTTAPVRLEYVSVSDLETFQEVEYVERPALLLVAAWIGTTRLIDNVLLDPGAP
jgi:pantoate--beta-alanine ligase